MTRSSKWNRGNIHMHSFWSDGHGFPEMITDWFYQQGYDFIAFTEHDRLQVGEKWVSCDPNTAEGRCIAQADLLGRYIGRFGDGWVEARERNGETEVRLKELAEYRPIFEESGQFVIIQGEEITGRWGDGSMDSTHWINALNLDSAVPPQHRQRSSEVITATCQAATSGHHGRNVLAILNHPNWRWNATAEDMVAEDLRFVEIHTALNSCNSYGDEHHRSVEQMWDIALTRRLLAGGALLYGIASDDAHAYDPADPLLDGGALPGRAWVLVRSQLNADALLDAMKQGNFYCSTGVSLRTLEWDAQRLHLEIQPEGSAQYLTRFIGTRRGFSVDEVGQVLAEVRGTIAQYDCTGDELYVRAAITSDIAHPHPTVAGDRQRAWTQPVIPGVFAPC